MTQTEYLLLLEEELKLLPQKDRKEVIAYYREKINTALDYGEKEEKIIERLPNPQQVAKEVYASKGTLYFIKRKKIQRRKDLVSACFSSLILVFLLLVAFSVTAFIFFLINNKFHMMANFLKAGPVEWVLTESFLLVYILLSIIVLLFGYDLVIIVANPLIDNIRALSPKTFHFDAIGFNFRSFFAKIFKKKKVLENSFFILVAIFIALGVIGFINKTYIYRAMTNTPLYEEKHIVQAEEIEKIVIDDYHATLKFEFTDEEKITIAHKYEFDRNLQITVDNGIAKVTTEPTKTYDLLGIITEPIHVITVLIPETKVLDLDITLEKGTLSFNKVVINEAIIAFNFGDILFNGLNAQAIGLTLDNVNWISEKSQIDDLNIHSRRGLIKSMKDEIDSMTVETYNAGVGIVESQINHLAIDSETSTIALEKHSGNHLETRLSTGTISLNQVNMLGDISIKTEYKGIVKLNDIVSNSLILNVALGQVVGSKLNTNLSNTEGNAAALLFDNLQGKAALFNKDSETEIIQSHLSELKLITNEKTTKIYDAWVDFGEIKVTSGICEIANLYGKKLSLNMDGTYLKFINDDETKSFEEITKILSNGATEEIQGVSAERWS
ncbi:MAG TPA: DUF1700 domain-containing protein [Acholeplasmataceae bacterium]|jgi:uncharacterized membrane protein/DUF4097 and DUF4098 domain-containing protein YvlB|nr:DUF1700 domain-containing protein [Acholeplasmataceae bacterium]